MGAFFAVAKNLIFACEVIIDDWDYIKNMELFPLLKIYIYKLELSFDYPRWFDLTFKWLIIKLWDCQQI